MIGSTAGLKEGVIMNELIIDSVTPWCNTYEPHAAIKQGNRSNPENRRSWFFVI